MSQFQKAADDIKAFASRIRGFLDVADTLEKIGNLEQAQSEANKKTTNAVEAAANAEKALASRMDKVSKIDAEIEYARKSAEEIIANATSRAMEIVDSAGGQANEVVKAIAEKKATLEKEIIALSEKSKGILSVISEKESILWSIESKIEAAKEKVASLFK